MEDTFLTPKELAMRWKITEQTLANWRSLDRGPPCIRISNRVLYRLVAVIEYESNCPTKKIN